VRDYQGLLDEPVEDPHARLKRQLIMAGTGIVLAVLVFYWLWFLYLHMPERTAAERFFNILSGGNTEAAYRDWKPDPAHYSYQDFLADWGPNGEYGPVKSYRVEEASNPPRGGSGVLITVEVSPDLPFPSSSDIVKSGRTKEVQLWVQKSDKSLSFSPFQF
jgi:hypothetical protein